MQPVSTARELQSRADIIEWLDEALRTRVARQPALYLSALDQLGEALNQPADLSTDPAYTQRSRTRLNPWARTRTCSAVS